MLEFTYHNHYLNSKSMCDVRIRLVLFAKTHGVKPAAREFATTVKTVRKWVRRFDECGQTPLPLADHDRRPNRYPRRIKPYWRFKIIDLCQQMARNGKAISASRLRREFNIPYSLPTILKVMHETGFANPHKHWARPAHVLPGNQVSPANRTEPPGSKIPIFNRVVSSPAAR